MSTTAPSPAALSERPVGIEARKTIHLKVSNKFIDRYLSGDAILDIGYKGYVDDVVPIVPQAIGVDLDYPGYDGHTLPFETESQDAVFTSHCLEHITDYREAIAEWFRVLKLGGFLIIVVPHKFLYEKRLGLPSRWNEDHKRFYTPASLMAEIEETLPPNTYRVRLMADNDWGYDYTIGPEQHAGGSYELEVVLQKLQPPEWELEEPPPPPPPEPPPPPPPAGLRVTLSNALKLTGRIVPGPIKAALRPLVRWI